MNVAALAPNYVQTIAPYQPGKPISELAREMALNEDEIIKLASNENPLGISPMAQQAIQQALTELSRYPDGNGFDLKTALSNRFGLQLENIILGNGSNDILELLARTFLTQQDSAIYSEFAFAVYPLVIQATGATGIEVPAKNYGHNLSAILAAIQANTKIIFIANPNNPTGTFLDAGAILTFLDQVPSHILVVLDEAYTEYLPTDKASPSLEWIERYPNLIVSRTFSKAYGLAGLRIGFGVAHPSIIAMMNRVRQPFNVNSLALAAAEASLRDHAFLTKTVQFNTEGLRYIENELGQLGLAFIPSVANFVTFHIKNAAQVNQSLLKQGVIVRPLAGYKMANSLRVSVGLPEENQRFISVLKRIIQG